MHAQTCPTREFSEYFIWGEGLKYSTSLKDEGSQSCLNRVNYLTVKFEKLSPYFESASRRVVLKKSYENIRETHICFFQQGHKHLIILYIERGSTE